MSDKKFKTIADLSGNRDEEHDSGSGSEDASDDERQGRRQGFFVGGSEHSGQQVLGPRGPAQPDDLFHALMRSARSHGAEVVNPNETSGGRQGSSGGGIRLGRGGESSSGAPPAASAQDNQPTGEQSGDEEANEVEVRLTLWANGFTVDDGPLRSPEDAANKEFIAAIASGKIPPELMRQHHGKMINLRMERKGSDYAPPKAKPFGGSGARLGGVVPNIVGAPAPSSSAPQAAMPDEKEKNLKEAIAAIGAKDDKEKTNVQVRLPDGSRLVAPFNVDQNISTIRNFVVGARPELAFQEFQMMTTFPNKIIDDESLTLKDAGLLNAVVMVKTVS
ncbi:hypothetical protein WR25_15691 [Diploscapter pachys]|uniref:NSFL1 cofactor p47 n=1 Tax=Diploscapter pachys TaxID=2018661 RepID=A0A2A2J3K7_9BILA|nr:hypothetical protein WR25_15691 [Diploscapter pachys]